MCERVSFCQSHLCFALIAIVVIVIGDRSGVHAAALFRRARGRLVGVG